MDTFRDNHQKDRRASGGTASGYIEPPRVNRLDTRSRVHRGQRVPRLKSPELAFAHQIIDSLGGVFEPAALTSSYRRDLRALLETKLQGEELPPPSEPVVERAPAIDLLEALKASVAAAKAGTPARTSKPKQPAAKSVAKSRARTR